MVNFYTIIGEGFCNTLAVRLHLLMQYFKSFILALLLLPFAAEAQQELNFDQLKAKANQTNFRTVYNWNTEVSNTIEDIRKLNLLLFFLTNEYRIKNKKKPLNYSEPLEYGAYLHAQQMATLEFFDHENRKNKALKTPTDRAIKAGIQNPYPAENIAMFENEQLTSYLQIAEKLIDIWHHSPPHKANMLAKDALELGCGVAHNKGEWYGTQLFQWYETSKVNSIPLEFK